MDSAQKVDTLEALLTVSKALSREIELEQLLRIIMEKAAQMLDADRSSLFLYDEGRNELWSMVALGLETKEIRFSADQGIAGHVAQSREVVNIPDAHEDERFNPVFDRETGYRTRSLLSMPLIGNGGRLLGVVQVINKNSGSAFSSEDVDMLEMLCSHAALAVERAYLVENHVKQQRFEHSLQLAHDIQMRMLPQVFPDHPAYDIHALMQPAQMIGGDFYDVFTIDEHRLGLIVADVAGKGIPAALTMAVTRTSLRITALDGADPASCIRDVNRSLYAETQEAMFVTVLYAILDVRTGALELCCAGHNHPYIVRHDGRVEMPEIKRNLPLFVLRDFGYTGQSLQLAPGDMLFLYTDGVTEATDSSRELFDDHRLRRALEGVNRSSSADVVHSVLADVQRFADGAMQSDDITMLAGTYLG